ncbi:tetratricopeptide repeat protein [Pyxidicoccus fallax]|uniref:Tetratricopeptide repeat protein n=1 Tax=Pyxidicoccus fallax TaxID=394095 RepID=A0A848LXV6_9BACT|nr:tetratricopeptide repeat protein [Pyxidicoccus fallax]NMO22420.1 tetratricopeptide repeat protein [Pyxidicoccus fallax]NPC84321.1 tetratricopeptide repeat protein [Pyxidicoccus fallax]
MVVLRRWAVTLSAALLLGAAEPSAPARAAFVRAEAALAAGRLDEAGSAYREALAATPGYAAALNGLGTVLFRQGQMGDAIVRFREATQADPEWKMAYFNLGYAARKAGDAATAAQAYERYTQLEPGDADGYYGLGESYRQLGQKDKAIAAYQGYIAREKRPGEQVWVRKAREHLSAMGAEPLPAPVAAPVSGQAGVAAAQPASGSALSGGTGVQLTTAGSARTGASMQLASGSVRSGAILQPASATPSGAAVQLASASSQPGATSAQGPELPAPFPESRTEGATPEPQRTPNAALAAARIRDGDALMKERRYREAAFAFLDASHADAGHVEALFKLGNAMAVLGYYGQAVERWERASRLTQDAAIRQSAQDNITRARTKMAQAGISPQAVGQPPGSGPVADTTRAQARRAYEQGVQRIGGKDYGGALTSLSQAIQLEPMLAVAYTARGSANIGLRRYAEAAADYQYALELEPSSASPLYGLAEAYRALGRNAEARALYERYASSSASDVRSQLQEESRQKAAKLR